MTQTSYQWQEECLARWIDSGGRGMVQAVTDSGKTRLALYYLHIEETSEDIMYLPDAGENRLVELRYEPNCRNFQNPDYDRAAMLVLEDMRKADCGILREAKRCLDCGRVRGDWMAEPEERQRRIDEASTVEERNYWICMKRVAAKSAVAYLKPIR